MPQLKNSMASQIAVQLHKKRLWYMQCCSMLCNVAYCTMLWHKKQCHGMKHNAMAQQTALVAHCQCRGTKMPWHKVQCHGTNSSTWHNATAHHGRLWHKAQHHGINHIATEQNMMLLHKNSVMAQKQPHSTKNCAMAQSTMLWHIKQCWGTKIAPQNAAEESAMLQQKTQKSKMPPTTATSMPPMPPKPKPNRLIVPSPTKTKTTKQQPPHKNHH